MKIALEFVNVVIPLARRRWRLKRRNAIKVNQ
jgi:hypothetical protein